METIQISVKVYNENGNPEAQSALDDACSYAAANFSFESGFEPWRGVWSGTIYMDDIDLVKMIAQKTAEFGGGDTVYCMKVIYLEADDPEDAFWMWYISKGKTDMVHGKVVYPEPSMSF